MMKPFLNVLVVFLALVSLSGLAVAQEGGEVKEKFYNFDDMLIDGDFKKPQGEFIEGRKKAKFDRTLKLKKSFLPKIQETTREDALDG